MLSSLPRPLVRRRFCGKAPNKVIVIEAPPRASDPGFLLKWLQGQWREARPARVPSGGRRGGFLGSLASLATVVSMVGSHAQPPAPGGGAPPQRAAQAPGRLVGETAQDLCALGTGACHAQGTDPPRLLGPPA